MEKLSHRQLRAGDRTGKRLSGGPERGHEIRKGAADCRRAAEIRHDQRVGAREIRFLCRAEKIRVENGRVVQVTASRSGETLEFAPDVLLSSMPLKDLAAGMNDIPASVSEIAAGLPYRDFVTVGLLVDRLNLKNETKLKTLNNIIPDCWIYVQDSGVKLGRIQIFNNWSPCPISILCMA